MEGAQFNCINKNESSVGMKQYRKSKSGDTRVCTLPTYGGK
jgi:hypothetical protein